MKKILAPIDFSDCASNALQYASAMATQTGSKLILVHIIPLQIVAPTQVPVVLVEPNNEHRAHVIERLEDLARHINTENNFRFEVETICEHGIFLDKMLKIMRQEQPDLIVMGTRGANSVLEKYIGTNTEALIMESEFPVLAVPESTHYHGISRIAFASNLKNREEKFLNQLFAFSNPLNTDVSIVNVKTEKHPNSDSDLKVIEYISGQFPQNNYSIAQLKGNNVVEGINTFLQENNVDILAIAIHKHGFFEGLFHESVSRELILHTKVPLLALHERQNIVPGSREVEQDVNVR